MRPEQWSRVEQLFHDASAQPPERRDEWLVRECASDDVLRREVESLLAQHTISGDMLDGSALAHLDAGRSTLIGERVGSYEILALIDEGGMGQVYRARDLTLPREVAVKVIPPAVAHEPARRARFRQEAELLASLSHPHIAHVYAFVEDGDRVLLVMELVPGRTLAQLIGRGPIPVAEALSIARQIADALDAAHEQGVVHRDLKPANVKIAPDSTVKILDFGLAAPLRRTASAAAPLSAERWLYGTAAYLSPEQARGERVDHRGDIWAFGCVLFEMLSGRQVYTGATVTDILAAILDRDPDWSALPESVPDGVRGLLRRCLDKDPRRRLRDVGEARVALDDALAQPASHGATNSQTSLPTTRRARVARSAAMAATVAAVTAVAWLGGWLSRGRTTPSNQNQTVRLLVGPSPADSLPARPTRTDVALSPDGRVLVFSGVKGSTQQLYARAIDNLDATPIPGTEGTNSPFFSPDGQWIAFWQGGQIQPGAVGELRKIRLDGGPPMTICRTALLFGASWGADDTIVFANVSGGLLQVPAAGGVARTLTEIDRSRDEVSHRLPHFLPDGRAILFTVTRGARGPSNLANAEIVVRSLDNGQQHTLISGGVDGRYVQTGHVVYARANTLMAVPFDRDRLTLTGTAITIVDGVLQAYGPFVPGGVTAGETGAAQFSVSSSGALAYVPGRPFPENLRSLVMVDRHGKETLLAAPPHAYLGPRLSSDGRRVLAFTIGITPSVWLYNLARRTFTPVVPDYGIWPIWNPDGRGVTFATEEPGRGVVSKPLEGDSSDALMGEIAIPGAWSPDGHTLVFAKLLSTGALEVRVWSRDQGDRGVRGSSVAPFLARFPAFSPDGHWLAFASDESGRAEVYVQTYPGGAQREQISTDGGVAPAWSRDGRELFYMAPSGAGSRLMTVSVSQGSTFTADQPQLLFEGPYPPCTPMRCYDPAPDGQHFVIVKSGPEPPPNEPVNTQMVLVLNWTEELKRLVPTR